MQQDLNYQKLENLLYLIDEPNRSICLKILKENILLFKTVQGSSHNHQAWKGGYFDHIEDVINIGIYLYNQLNKLRPLDFKISDVVLILFLHDIEKPWKYELIDNVLSIKKDLINKIDQKKFRNKKLNEYGIKLNEQQENAMNYVEGEKDDYSSEKRVMNSLAALCHMADTASARIWFDYPSQNDEWKK